MAAREETRRVEDTQVERHAPVEDLGTVEDVTELGNGEPDWEDDGNYADPVSIIWGDGPAS